MPRGPTYSLQSLALCRGYSDQVISPPVCSRPESQRRPACRQRSIHAQVCTPEHQSKHHRQAAKTISPPSICGLVCPRLRNVSCSNAPRTQVRPTTSHAGSHLWDSPSTLAHVSLDGHRPQHRKTNTGEPAHEKSTTSAERPQCEPSSSGEKDMPMSPQPFR